MTSSKNHSTENLKITYFLGAGASYQSNPIWKAQGSAMINVADYVLSQIADHPISSKDYEYISLMGDKDLMTFFKDLKNFGKYAVEYGSIDIYAKRLSLIEDKIQLNKLKFCLSVYFDLWENFLQKNYILENAKKNGESDMNYDKIDKRYFSFLSVILEKGNNNFPKLNDNISILTWNYDLQFENAFESFMPRNSNSMKDLNNYLNFMNDSNSRKEIIHLNGFRGYFRDKETNFETVEKSSLTTLANYLTKLKQTIQDFKNPDYTNSIKYAWEHSSEAFEYAKKVMSESNILVIIGYSFPAFNRKIDNQLFEAFEKKEGYKKVYYQDPFLNLDLVNLLFSDQKIIEPITDRSQFHIPHEFLSPHPAAEIYV